jgi:pyrroline-5-carboxylate reductase
MSSDLKLGLVGAGKMATALAKGFVQAKLVAPESILAADPEDGARYGFGEQLGCQTTASNPEVLGFANVILLAVKPDHVWEVMEEIRPAFTENHLLLSIAAGVRLTKLEDSLPDGARVVRVMPNTPALLSASATAYALGKHASEEDGLLAQRLFSAVGIAFKVKERLLDAVTGLSGSGPAYVYLMIEALSDGGVAAGLPRDIATKLAAQTMLGSAKMVLETGQHPAVLKDMVTSPGGTTVEGLHELESAGVRGALMNAVRAATEKSRKLGQA